MKVIIDIPNEIFEDIKNGFYGEHYGDFRKLAIAIGNGTPIPDNATNGDMIKAMFDCQEDEEQYGNDNIWVTFNAKNNPSHNFDLEWWNSPYKGVEE